MSKLELSIKTINMDNEINDANQDPLEKDLFMEADVTYASFWERVGASLLDTLFLIPIMAASFYNNFGWKNLGIAIVIIFISFFYKFLLEFYYGATWGKMVLKLKVVNEAYEEMSMSQTLLRMFPWVLTSVASLLTTYWMFSEPGFEDVEGFMDFSVFSQELTYMQLNSWIGLIFIISIIFIFWEKKKQTLHDKVANTYVIKNI